MRKIGLIRFFEEKPGELSSIRLVMIFTDCVVVPLFLLGCFFSSNMIELAPVLFTFAGAVTAIKSAQKVTEDKIPTPPENR